jgi:LmbE family N-acetylglucosaminyl deacetylase
MTRSLIFDRTRDRQPLRVLCLGAHSEIGCGGTLLKLLAAHKDVEVTWVVLSGETERAVEARASARLFLRRAARRDVRLFAFRGSYFPSEMTSIKDAFESLKSVEPDLVFTHTRADHHQDHRVVCELTWNTFRRHTILEYEIPKYDGDTGAPNAFVELSAAVIAKKAEWLMQCFGTQRSKHWFSADLFTGLARLRGIQCAAQSGFAEAFFAPKVSLF